MTGEYNESTGDYGDDIIYEEKRHASVTDTGTDTMNLVYGAIKQGTAVLSKGDKLIAELEDAMDSDKLIEIWEANLEDSAEPGPNKFKGMYFQGYLTEVEITSSAEENVEVSLTFGINGSGKRGDVTVTTQQQEVAAYVFKDTTQAGE